MSDAPVAAAPVPDPVTPLPVKIFTPQTIMGYAAMALVFLIVCKILWSGTSELQSQVLVLATTTVGVLLGYYFRISSTPHPTSAPAEPVKAPAVIP